MNEQNKNWNEKPVNIILLIFFFFPLGLYFMFKNKVFSKNIRMGVLVFFGLILGISIISGGGGPSQDVLIDNIKKAYY